MNLSSTIPFVRDRFTWLAYFMLAYYSFSLTIIGPLMPFLRHELKLSYTVTGLHLSAFALGMVIAGLTADRFSQWWGRRRVFWGGGAGMAFGTVALALSGHPGLTIFSTWLMGYLGSLLLVMIQTTLADRHGEQRAIALTESNVGASLTASLAPLVVGGFQATLIGWRGAPLVAMVMLVLLALSFYRVIIPEAKPHALRAAASGRRLPLVFWAYWVVNFIGVSIEWCLIFWGADFLEKVVGLSQINAVTLMSVFLGAMVLGRFVGSRLSRTYPSARLLLGAMVITIIGFPFFWLARLAPLNILGLFIAGFGVANMFPLTLATALSVAPQQVDQASARIPMGSGLAIFISPLILGGVADQLGIHNAYGIVALLTLTAITLAVLANRLTINNCQLPIDN